MKQIQPSNSSPKPDSKQSGCGMHGTSSWQGWVGLLVLLAIGGYLFTAQRAGGLLSALLLLAFIACPIMMYFMMRGMHGDNGGKGSGGR